MSRISKRKRIYMCMASVMCMLLLLIPLPVSANNQGSILLKATVEDEAAVYNLSNTEFTMYQVGIYKKNSWVLETEFAKSGVVFDFEDSSAQAEAAKKLEKYVQDNNIRGMSGKTNSDGEVMYRNLEKGVYLFVQIHTTQIGNQVYRSEPFIITVPGNYDGQIIWNVTAEPKFKNESIPPITTNTPPVSEEPSGDNSSRTPNVKTGDDTNVIMWLSNWCHDDIPCSLYSFFLFFGWHTGGKSIFLADAITDPADFMVAPLIGNILVMINKRIMQEIIKRFYEHEARISLM